MLLYTLSLMSLLDIYKLSCSWVQHNLRDIKSSFKKEHDHNAQYIKFLLYCKFFHIYKKKEHDHNAQYIQFFKKAHKQAKTEAKDDVKGGLRSLLSL
jgi:hypothetical protein